MITHSLPRRRGALGRGTPAAPRSTHAGPSLRSGRRRGRGPGRWRGAAGTCEPGRHSRRTAARRRLRASAPAEQREPGAGGPPAPSPQPERGSDNEDISRKLYEAGGRAQGEWWRPSKHCRDILPRPVFGSLSLHGELSQGEGEGAVVDTARELAAGRG